MNKKYKVVFQQIGIWILFIIGYLLLSTLFMFATGYKFGYLVTLAVFFGAAKCCKKVKETYKVDSWVEELISENQEELICKKCGAELNQNSKFCSSCGKKINNNKNFKAIFISVSVILLIGIGVSVTFNIIQYDKNYRLNSKISETEERLKEKTKLSDYYKEKFIFYFNKCNDYEDEIWILEEKSDFMDDYIEIVGVDDYYYHKYDCKYLDTSEFYAFNEENAIYQGYHKCPHCH